VSHRRFARLCPLALGLSLILVLPACQEALVRAPKNDAPLVIDTPQAVVQALGVAYHRRDFGLLRSILAHEPARNADYVFFLSQPTESGETGRSGKFLLYIWEDLGWQGKTRGARTGSEPPSWSAIKSVYR
jgi:hypothetical protein